MVNEEGKQNAVEFGIVLVLAHKSGMFACKCQKA
jgi:hypothetical protein